MTKQILLENANLLREQITADRRYIHSHAEVGFDTVKTKEYIFTRLAEMGYKPVLCGKCGVKAEIGEGKECVLLRADIDALPIKETADIDYASENNMHACGHDMHAAMLLGAAKLIKQREHQLKGKVVFMFQPAEEILGGAKDMINDGILEGVTKALMIHVIAGVELPAGTVIVSSPGVSAPASDHFTISVSGKGCHGSAPWQGVDASVICANILTSLQNIQAREIHPQEETVLTIGYMHCGQTGNAIADTGVMKGTARSYDENTRKYLQKRIIQISRGIAETYRGEAEVEFTAGAPALINEREISNALRTHLTELLGEKSVLTTAMMSPDGRVARGGGSEDFAYVCEKVPSVMLSLCAGDKNEGYEYPQHHPQVRFDEKVLPTGAAVYAWSALCLTESV